jgi:protein-disulfide isomerase
MMTLIACVLVVFGFNKMQKQMYDARLLDNADVILRRYTDTLQQLTADGRVFMVKWEQSAPTPIPLRADDPKRTDAEDMANTFSMVVYSDFGCPQCRRLSDRIEKQIQPLFAGNLLVWFKHYPLDTTCNPLTSELKHPHACDAARMAEGARALMGNAAFWLVHDFLFAHQDEIRPGKVTPERVAPLIGVDPAALREAMMSEAVTQRLMEDFQAARAAGLPGTPGVYINDRRVEFLALDNMRFWDLLADLYWQMRKTERPESTRLTAPAPATPGTQGSSTAP